MVWAHTRLGLSRCLIRYKSNPNRLGEHHANTDSRIKGKLSTNLFLVPIAVRHTADTKVIHALDFSQDKKMSWSTHSVPGPERANMLAI